mmetsp:Transcript_27702/g.94558  ORF Transcript_27702/g.94558 Transcript_27702/m.94558 type:complete len:210 (-) Transcript_27702:108-737(-)
MIRSCPSYFAVAVAVCHMSRLDHTTKSPGCHLCAYTCSSRVAGAHAASQYAFASSKPILRSTPDPSAASTSAPLTWYVPTIDLAPDTASRTTSGWRRSSASSATFTSSAFLPSAESSLRPSGWRLAAAKSLYRTRTRSGGGSSPREEASSAARTLDVKSVSPPSGGVTMHRMAVTSGGGEVSARPSQCHARSFTPQPAYTPADAPVNPW